MWSSGGACYVRLQHAGSGGRKTGHCCGHDLAEGLSQWIAGSARPLGRTLLDLDIVPAQLVAPTSAQRRTPAAVEQAGLAVRLQA
jgi:hypothetical protein